MLMSAELKTGNPPPGGWGSNFIVPWWTLNFHLTLEVGGGGVLRNGGLEFSTLFLGVKKDKVSQSLFAYQVKFNFSIKNIFSKEYCDIKDTLICKVNSNLKLP